MPGEQTPNSRSLGECTSEEAFAAELQGQAERAKETKAAGHHRMGVEGQNDSQGRNPAVGKGLISDVTRRCFQCGDEADFKVAGDPWCWKCDAAAHYAYGKQSVNDTLGKAWAPEWLLAEVKKLRNLVQVMDLAGGEAVRQRDNYAAEVDRLLKRIEQLGPLSEIGRRPRGTGGTL